MNPNAGELEAKKELLAWMKRHCQHESREDYWRIEKREVQDGCNAYWYRGKISQEWLKIQQMPAGNWDVEEGYENEILWDRLFFSITSIREAKLENKEVFIVSAYDIKSFLEKASDWEELKGKALELLAEKIESWALSRTVSVERFGLSVWAFEIEKKKLVNEAQEIYEWLVNEGATYRIDPLGLNLAINQKSRGLKKQKRG